MYISIKHILNKLYLNDTDILNNNNDFFANYKNYHHFLNDFASTIYSKYNSSIDSLYIEMCKYLDIEIDNKYTLEHTILKLEKQTPQLLLSLTDIEIQKQTIENFDEKLDAIYHSVYYKKNYSKYSKRINNLELNINLVKKGLNL